MLLWCAAVSPGVGWVSCSLLGHASMCAVQSDHGRDHGRDCRWQCSAHYCLCVSCRGLNTGEVDAAICTRQPPELMSCNHMTPSAGAQNVQKLSCPRHRRIPTRLPDIWVWALARSNHARCDTICIQDFFTNTMHRITSTMHGTPHTVSGALSKYKRICPAGKGFTCCENPCVMASA